MKLPREVPRHWHVVAIGMLCTLVATCSSPVECDPCPVAEPVELRAPSPEAHQEEPSVAVLPGGRVVVAWKEMPTPAGVGSLGFAHSDDGGATWSMSQLPRPVGSPGQSDPWLVARPTGRIVASRYSDCGVAVTLSDDGGEEWSNWRELHETEGCADKPSLSRRQTGPLLLAYHVIESSSEDVRIDLTLSGDDGATWSPPRPVAPEAGAVRLAPVAESLPDGSLVVAWWGPDIGSIEVTRSSDGVSWEPPVRVNAEEGSVPRAASPLLRPPFPSLAVSGSTLVLAWPDAGSGDWNVMAARSDDGGETWSDPQPLDSGGPGDQWMVSVAAGSDGRLHAAWYDSADGPTTLRYAVSEDGGRTWRVVSEEPGVVREDRARLGDYLGLAVAPDGEPFVAWTAVRGDSLRVFAARATRLGEVR